MKITVKSPLTDFITNIQEQSNIISFTSSDLKIRITKREILKRMNVLILNDKMRIDYIQ